MVWKKAKRFFGRVFLRQTRLDQMSLWELERQIQKLENMKREKRSEMDEIKAEYDARIEEAKTADESRVKEIKTEASRLLSKYDAFRSQWVEVNAALRYFQQAALGKKVQSEGIEALPSEMSPAHFERSAQRLEQKVEERDERISDFTFGAKQLEGVHRGGRRHMDQMADSRVDQVIDDARNGNPVPTLDELADDTFGDRQTVDAEHEGVNAGKSSA